MALLAQARAKIFGGVYKPWQRWSGVLLCALEGVRYGQAAEASSAGLGFGHHAVGWELRGAPWSTHTHTERESERHTHTRLHRTASRFLKLIRAMARRGERLKQLVKGGYGRL